MPSKPLNSLLSIADQTKPYKKALSTGRLPNQSFSPEVENFGLQSALADEFQERIGMSQRAGAPPEEIAGLKTLLGIREKNIATSPITSQRAENDAFRAAEQDAIREGFRGDQIMTQFGNTWESQGVSPIEAKRKKAEEMTRYQIDAPARNAVAQARAQGEEARKRDLINNTAILEREQLAAERLKSLFSGGTPGSTPATPSGYGYNPKTGATSMRWDTNPNPAVSTGAAKELGDAVQLLGTQTNEQDRAAVQQRVDVLRAHIAGNYPTHPMVRQWALDAVNSVSGTDTSLEDIMKLAEETLPQENPNRGAYLSQLRGLLSQLGVK